MEYIDAYAAYKWRIILLLSPCCPLANSSGPTSKRQNQTSIWTSRLLSDCCTCHQIKHSMDTGSWLFCFPGERNESMYNPKLCKRNIPVALCFQPCQKSSPWKRLKPSWMPWGNGWIASTAMTLSVQWWRVVGSGSTSKYWKDIEGMFQNNNQLPSVTNQLPTWVGRLDWVLWYLYLVQLTGLRMQFENQASLAKTCVALIHCICWWLMMLNKAYLYVCKKNIEDL